MTTRTRGALPRRTLLAGAAGLVATTALGASAARAATSPIRPSQMVSQGVNALLDFLRGNPGATAQQLREFLDAEVAPHFDFDYMARWAAGAYLRRLDEAQLTALGERVRELFIGGLARNLGAIAQPAPKVHIHRARPGRDRREQVVPVVATLRPGWRVRLQFRCYWNGERWRVFDVSANGASAVAYFRNHFGAQLRRHGPGILTR